MQFNTRWMIACLANAVILASVACAGGNAPSAPAGAIEGVRLAPATVTIGVGSSTPLEAVVLGSDGMPVAGVGVKWSSSDTDIARVSTNGVVTAVAVGSVQIAATVQGRSAVATVQVVPTPVASVTVTPTEVRMTVGERSTPTVRVFDANGAALAGRAVQWKSSNTQVATVNDNGEVTAIGPGATSVSATAEGRTATVAVVVGSIAVSSVRISPATASVTVGTSTQLSAQALDANGSALVGRTIAWSTSTPSVISVAANGQVVGVSRGSGIVTASVEGVSATATVTVSDTRVASLQLSPGSLSLVVGNSATLVAQPRDASGNLLTGRTVAWSSSAPGVASVSSAGVVSAVSPGAAVVTATVDGQVAIANVTVSAPQPPPVVVGRVDVSPSQVRLFFNGNQNRSVQLVARAYTTAGQLIPEAVFVYTTSNAAVATVSPSGVVTAVTRGTAVITATSGARFGTSQIEVTSK